MNAARRNAHRRGWPRGLYEPRPGYYVWRDPRDGKAHIIGRVSLAAAKAEALAANLHIEGQRPALLDRVTGSSKTIGDVIDQMPVSEVANTRKSNASLDKIIRASLGSVACFALRTADIAPVIEQIEATGKARQAQAVRYRLMSICNRAQQLGWLDHNPVEPTRAPKVVVKRKRLTLETFLAIRDRADEVQPWLKRAMNLSLLLGADRSTVASLTRANVQGDWLEYTRPKTGQRIRVHLDVRLDAVGLSLRDVVKTPQRIASRYLIHHHRKAGAVNVGDPVSMHNISASFTKACRLAGLADENHPTQHEIRSLSKRLYDAEGRINTKHLLGHKHQHTADIYADARGAEPMVVTMAKA